MARGSCRLSRVSAVSVTRDPDPRRGPQYTQAMADWLIAAVAAVLPAFIAGWLAGRVRWRHEQSKIVMRLLATSDKALEALDRGADPSDALTDYAEAFAEADLLLPGRSSCKPNVSASCSGTRPWNCGWIAPDPQPVRGCMGSFRRRRPRGRPFEAPPRSNSGSQTGGRARNGPGACRRPRNSAVPCGAR